MLKRGPLTQAEHAQRVEAAHAPRHRHQAETTPSVRQGSSGAPSRAAIGLFRQGQARPDTRATRGVFDTRATELPVGAINARFRFHFPKAYRSETPDPPLVTSPTRPLMAMTLGDVPTKRGRRMRRKQIAERNVEIVNPQDIAEALRHPKMREILQQVSEVIRSHQKPTIEQGYRKRLIPEGTPPGLAAQAYKEATLTALHKLGLGHYETKMDMAAKRQLRPLNRFMWHAMRRVFDHMNQPPLQGKWEPFRQEFGQLYRQRKHGQYTGHERMRMAPRTEFIKLDVGDDLDLMKAFDAAKHKHLQPKIKLHVPDPPGGIPKIGGAHLHVRDAAKMVERHFRCPPIGRMTKRQDDGTFLILHQPELVLRKEGFYLGADPYGSDPYVSFTANPKTQLSRAMRPRRKRMKLKLRLNAQRGLRRALSGGITRQGRWQLGLSSSPNADFLKQEPEARELDRQERLEHLMMGAKLHGRSAAGNAVRRLGQGHDRKRVVNRLLAEHQAELRQIQRERLSKGIIGNALRYGARRIAGAAGRTKPVQAASRFAAKPPVARALGEAKSEGWKGVLAPGRFAGRMAGAAIGHRRAIAGLGAAGLAADFTPQVAVGAHMLGVGGQKQQPPVKRTVGSGGKAGFRMSAMGKPLSSGPKHQPTSLRKAALPLAAGFGLLGRGASRVGVASAKAAGSLMRHRSVQLGAAVGAGLAAHHVARDWNASPKKRMAIGAAVAGTAAALLSRGHARLGVLRSSRNLFSTGLKQGASKKSALSAARAARKTGLAGIHARKKLVAGAAALGAGAGYMATGSQPHRLSMVEQ